MRATGAVFWSAAARRGSPGYVLSSGDALFRLYRATGDVALLELLRDTVHNLAQYLPDADAAAARRRRRRPCAPLRRARTAGAGSKRGTASVPADGMFDAIGLLSYTEVPGIYVRADTGFVFVFDHVTARIKERADGARAVLTIANPTRTEANVRILSETAARGGRAAAPGRRARRADRGGAGGGTAAGERAAAWRERHPHPASTAGRPRFAGRGSKRVLLFGPCASCPRPPLC